MKTQRAKVPLESVHKCPIIKEYIALSRGGAYVAAKHRF